jgi:hypothetical protein
LPAATPAVAPAPPPATIPSVVNVKSASASSGPKVGMTTDEVKAMWGEPVDRYEDEQINGRFLVWEYGSNRSVRFNPKRRVASVQQ